MADIDYACLDPVVEVRGVWIDAGAIPKTARGIRQMVRSYANANFNMLLPETICRGYAIYPSTLIGRDPRFAGAVDPLRLMIDEAHKLGIEVHPWVWVFRAGYAKDKGSILRRAPRLGRARHQRQGPLSQRRLLAQPHQPCRQGLPRVRLRRTGRPSMTSTDIHLDYIRYEIEDKSSYGFAPTSTWLFEKQYGVNPADVQPGTLDQLFWIKFRERQVNTFVQRIALQTRSIRPRAIISAAVGQYPPDARVQLLQNWPNWAANKWIDLVVPMSYEGDDARFGRLILRQREALRCPALLAEGLGVFRHKDPAQTVAQIAISRRMGVLGQVVFAASYMGPAQFVALKCGPYARPAVLPFRDLSRACELLSEKANECRAAGNADLAVYYANAAKSLADYDAYRRAKTGYVAPELPQLP